MKQIVTNAAGITILNLIDNTLKTGGGPASIGATVVRSPKGQPGKILNVNAATWESVLGAPYPKTTTDRTMMEGLRHVKDACDQCQSVNVVRVLHSDAMFPEISFSKIVNKGAWVTGTAYAVGDVVTVAGSTKLICVVANTGGVTEPTAADPDWDAFVTPVVTSAKAYTALIELAAGNLGMFYPIDGDPSTSRSVAITMSTTELAKKRFTIKFYDKDSLGVEYLLEYWQVGLDVNDKDDMGRSAYIETLLEERSTRFRCKWDSTINWAGALDTLTAISALTVKPAFTGGTNGGDPLSTEWIAAWDMYRNENVSAYLMFAAGNYEETVLGNCISIAEARHTMFFLDLPCEQNMATATAWLASASLSSRFAAAYYCPIAASDEWYGGKTVWGCSGAVAAACAKGDASFSGEVPGVHYSPAGQKRGTLARTGVEFIYPNDVIDRDALYEARINPIVSGSGGTAVIDDALTLHFEQNYSRFVWVNRIANYIDYRFLEMASAVKHEPDGLTDSALSKGMKAIMDGLVTSGAIVKPRYTNSTSTYTVSVSQAASDTSPYIFTVEQPEIDRWLITWSFCPVGSARRIVGQPILIM